MPTMICPKNHILKGAKEADTCPLCHQRVRHLTLQELVALQNKRHRERAMRDSTQQVEAHRYYEDMTRNDGGKVMRHDPSA